jgi:putative ABC transport system permease protein
MAIPVAYNLLSAKQRWTSSVVAVLGIAGTVGVFVAMLALARGFKATLTSSGLPQNVIVQRAGADNEMTSVLTLDDVRIVEDAPQVARGDAGPLVSPEVVVIAALGMRHSDGEANVQIRGVQPRVLGVRDNVKLVEGRFLTPGLAEAVVGKGARDAYLGLDLGATVRIGAGTWTIVGVFDGKGTAFDSEVWADAATLNGFYQRPPSVFQSATVRLRSAESDEFPAFEALLKGDPRLNLQALREQAYYEKQSQVVTTLITVLGGLVAAVMALGAVFGALNTMYSAVSERAREIAVLRAIGFGGGAIVLSFFVESLIIATVGGLVGCVAVLPVNGLTTGTINWQTFSHLAFAFRITPDLLLLGMLFALVMGALGGLPPAIRAARANVARTLRAL